MVRQPPPNRLTWVRFLLPLPIMRLKVSTEFEPLIDLEYHLGFVKINFAKEELRPAVQRWLDHGLNEWVMEGTYPNLDHYPRSTTSEHPDFLPRLRDYLARQFHFYYELTS